MRPVSFLFILLTLIGFSCTTAQEEEIPDNDLTRSVDSLIQLEVKGKYIPSIAVGIVKDGEVVLEKAYGYADFEEKIAADELTLYQLGSVTKMFTGHVLAQLVENGDMSLDDRLAGFFPK